jgi:hypothetical protein
MVWTGLLIGLIFGALLQRGRVCFNSAFRDVKLIKDNYVFKIGILTVALSMIFFHFAAQFGWIRMSPPTFNWISTILGAFVFGMGMVLAGGCASGVTYRIGEGLTTAWMAAFAYGLTAFAAQRGALSFIRNGLSSFNVTVANENEMYTAVTGPTLSSLLGISPWIPALIVAALLLWYVFGTKTTPRKSTMDWRLLSVLLAIVAVVAYILSFAAGRNYGLGITGSWVALWNSFLTGAKLNWASLLIIGIIVGATITAVVNKEFKLRMPKQPSTYAKVLLGGFLMGLGATLAGGCNIGHFLTGLPMLGISSILASVFFILGNWAMTWFLYERE